MLLLNYVLQMMIISGLLAGFAFSAALQFLSTQEKRVFVSVVVSVFVAAALLLLSVILIGAVAIRAQPVLGGLPQENLDHFESTFRKTTFPIIVILFRGGLYAFLGGVGLVGWIRSKVVGVVSSVSALMVIVLLVVLSSQIDQVLSSAMNVLLP